MKITFYRMVVPLSIMERDNAVSGYEQTSASLHYIVSSPISMSNLTHPIISPVLYTQGNLTIVVRNRAEKIYLCNLLKKSRNKNSALIKKILTKCISNQAHTKKTYCQCKSGL